MPRDRRIASAWRGSRGGCRCNSEGRVHDLNISDQGDVGKTLELDGIVADEILNVAGDSAVASQAKAETAEAIEKGIFGSPTYVIGDDWFFGQDRLAFLRGHLKNL